LPDHSVISVPVITIHLCRQQYGVTKFIPQVIWSLVRSSRIETHTRNVGNIKKDFANIRNRKTQVPQQPILTNYCFR